MPAPPQRPSLAELARTLWVAFFEIHAFDLAAQLAFYALLALFPFAMLVGTVVGFLEVPGLLDELRRVVAYFAPAPAVPLLDAAAENVLRGGGTGLFVFGVVGTMVSASGGIAALTHALNLAYGVVERRSWFAVRLRSVLITVVSVALVIVASVAMLIGPALAQGLADFVGQGHAVVVAWAYLRWPFAAFALFVLLAYLYWACPDVDAPPRLFTLGGAVAVPAWLLVSEALNLYFAMLPSFNRTYGALGAGVALMLWLQLSSLVVILGGQVNGILARRGAHRGGGDGP